MATLVFDATQVEPLQEASINITLGSSKREFRWVDRRELTWPELCAMFETAPIGHKDGPCYTPAIFTGRMRRKDQAERIDIAVLDSDCGHTLGEITNAVRKRGWSAIIHSTYSHLTDATQVSASAFDKWQSDTGGEIDAYMREKKGYLPRIVASSQIVDDQKDDQGNRLYTVKHAPCPKYRVIIQLEISWRAADHPSQDVANAIWAEHVAALAGSLGLHHDQSCTDTSRLFYFPRVQQDGHAYEHVAVAGKPCELFALEKPAQQNDEQQPKLKIVPSQDVLFGDINLTHWAAAKGVRFQVVNALRARSPGIFGPRVSGVKKHITCPFDDEHTVPGDRTGTWAINASDIGRAGMPGFTSGFWLGCQHNACSGRDRLQFLVALLANNSLRPEDLTDDRFLHSEAHDLSPADTSALLIKAGVAAEPKEPVPSRLYEGLPGVMGEMHSYIVDTAHKPQPALALAAVLALMAAVVGRKVELVGWYTRPNIYCLCVAVTGAGKDRPITGAKDILKAAAASDLIGAEDISSDSGIVTEVRRAPSQVMLIDEIGALMSSVMARTAGAHLRGVISVLLRLYSSSRTKFKSKSYVDQERVFWVDQPSASMLAMTTPPTFFGALSQIEIESGLLSRVVVFDAGDRDPMISPPGQHGVPDSVVEWIRSWQAVPLHENPIATEGGEVMIQPRRVALTGAAQHILASFGGEMHHAKQRALKDGYAALYVRALENALKFALIRSTSRGTENLVVNENDASWACDLSRSLTEHMVSLCKEHITDTPFGERVKKFAEAIRRTGARGLTAKEMARNKGCQLPERERDAVLDHLTRAGQIRFFDVNQGKTRPAGVGRGEQKVRQRLAYVWIDGAEESDDAE